MKTRPPAGGFASSICSNRQMFEEKVRTILDEKNFYLKHYLNAEPLDPEPIIDQYAAYAERLAPYVVNVSVILNHVIEAGQQVLFEGAQGTHLDIDHGTYPYVTSSNTVAGNACCGAGVGPKAITDVIGIVKAYTTRVGHGPFPSELLDDIGDRIQEKGAEFGATTGRRRRCGWLDTVIVKNAARLNGLTGLPSPNSTSLADWMRSRSVPATNTTEQTIDTFPASLNVLANCKPVYETLPGWTEDISSVRNFEELPENAKNYLATD